MATRAGPGPKPKKRLHRNPGKFPDRKAALEILVNTQAKEETHLTAEGSANPGGILCVY